ncbi:hypothetical protein EKK58_07375 [Candidatus Dependentiae bacterium]|nr:MAG: hypothetical protein EKK58_07375 [Candidatus Dependentiae bacterium]
MNSDEFKKLQQSLIRNSSYGKFGDIKPIYSSKFQTCQRSETFTSTVSDKSEPVFNLATLLDVMKGLKVLEDVHITKYELHSKHEVEALKKHFTEIINYVSPYRNPYEPIPAFREYSGVPIEMNLEVEPLFIRACYSDNTFKEYKMFKGAEDATE